MTSSLLLRLLLMPLSAAAHTRAAAESTCDAAADAGDESQSTAKTACTSVALCSKAVV